MEKKEKIPAAEAAVAKPKKIHGIKLNDVNPAQLDGKQSPKKLARKEIAKDALIAKALPKADEPQVFTASVDAFGKSAVAVNSIVRKNQHDVTLAFAEDNFTFDQVFKDFANEMNNLFVFDDVRIHLREKTQTDDTTVNVMRFNGILKMDNALLSPLKDFLKCDSGLLLNGVIESTGEDITEKISPCNVRLKSAVSFMLPLADGVILQSAALKVVLEQVDGKWTFTESIMGKLQINKLGNTTFELDATVTYTDGKLNVVATMDSITGLFGIEKLALEKVKLEFNVGSENDIELSADFKPGNTKFNFDGKISSEFTGIKASSPEFTFNDLNDLFQYFNNDTLVLPSFDLTFNDVFIGLATADGTLESGDIKQGLTIGGSVKVYDHTVTALAQLSSDGVEFTGTLADLTIGPVNITKTELDMKFCTASSGKASSFSLMGETVIEGLTLDCKVAYEKDKGVTNQLVYASIHAESFGLSDVFPPAKDSFVDSLKFSKVVFIYSSADSDTQDPDFEFAVKKGLQLTAVLEEIPALTTLTHNKKTGLILSAHFGNTTDISIEIPDTRLDLGNGVTCDPMRIAIELAPQPALQLIFGLNVIVPKQSDPLHFDLMLEVGVTEARGSATMKGYWVNPFGVNGLQVGPELALQMGIIYAQFVSTGLPSEFGFAGGVMLGDVTGRMVVNISEDPTHEILMGEIARLSPQNLVKFASTITGLSIDANDVPNFFDLEELKLYCAPTGGSIGTINFEPGFSFAADLILFDKRINVYTLFNDTGVIAKGELDKIELGPLKITGANGGNAKLDLELTAEKQSVYVNGAFEFLGTGESIYLDISNKGASFELEQKFLNMLKYKFRATTTGSFSDLPNLDFSFYAEFDNDLTEYIKTTVVEKINDARRAVDVSIADAQKQVDDAEKVYMAQLTPAKAALDKAQKDADAELARCTKEVNDQKAVWDAKVSKAQADVTNAKATYDNAMKDAQNKVAQAKTTYDNAVRDANNALNYAKTDANNKIAKAQSDATAAINNYNNSFGKAYSDLNSAQNAVNSLQSTINTYQYKIDHASWSDYFGNVEYWGTIVAGAWVSMKTAQGVLSACQAVVNGFQTSSVAIARNTANAALTAAQQAGAAAINAAQQTVNNVTYGTAYVAFNTAQGTLTALQYGAQYTAWQVATGTLQAAQTTGRGLLDAAEYSLSNIGKSVAYVALEGAKYSLQAIMQGTAAVAFQTAKGVLEGAKQGTDGILQLSAYIAAHIGDLLEVKQVTLAASLKGVKQGNLFKATFDGSVLSHAYNVTLDFNVKDATAFIEDLFKKVLDEAKRIAS